MTKTCHDVGYNSSNRGLKLFGVRMTDVSVRKYPRMGGILNRHYHGSTSNLDRHQPTKGVASRFSERKKGVPWSEMEHSSFLLGLQVLGKGDWKGISTFYVGTRTPTQVASHAQKHFNRQTDTNGKKRRASMFDMAPNKHLDEPYHMSSRKEEGHGNHHPLPLPPLHPIVLEPISSNTSDAIVTDPNPDTSNAIVAVPNPDTSVAIVAVPNPDTSDAIVAVPNPDTSDAIVAVPNPDTSDAIVAAPNPDTSDATVSVLNPYSIQRSYPVISPPVSNVAAAVSNPEAMQFGYHLIYIPAYVPYPYAFWAGTGPTENRAHEVIKPIALYRRTPLGPNEVGDMLKLSLAQPSGDSRAPFLPLKVPDGLDRQSVGPM